MTSQWKLVFTFLAKFTWPWITNFEKYQYYVFLSVTFEPEILLTQLKDSDFSLVSNK